LHDKAPAQSAMTMKCFLVNHGMMGSVSHYSPDLASADLFLFPKVKTTCKRRIFPDFKDIKNN
jgi:hypothetical protein